MAEEVIYPNVKSEVFNATAPFTIAENQVAILFVCNLTEGLGFEVERSCSEGCDTETWTPFAWDFLACGGTTFADTILSFKYPSTGKIIPFPGRYRLIMKRFDEDGAEIDSDPSDFEHLKITCQRYVPTHDISAFYM